MAACVSDAPFVVYAEEAGVAYPDTMWVDLNAPETGVVRAYGAVDGNDFFVAPIGMIGAVLFEARRGMDFDVFDPMTGGVISSHGLSAGEQVRLSGYEAVIIKGVYR